MAAQNDPVRRHATLSAAQAIGGLVSALFLFYLILIRPFSTGFDLVSVRDGTAARPLGDGDPQSVETQLSGVTSLILSGEHAGAEAKLDRLEQVLGKDRPLIYGLEVRGRQEEALFIGVARPGEEAQVYQIEAGLSATTRDSALKAPQFTLDSDREVAETSGATFIEDDGLSLEAEHGIRLERGGNLEIR